MKVAQLDAAPDPVDPVHSRHPIDEQLCVHDKNRMM